MSVTATTPITVVVIAKECLPGRVKTRLTPALSPEAAARVASASLDDTLRTVAALPVERRVLFFDGSVVPGAAAGFDVLHQPGGGLDERLGFLFDTMTGPTLLVGMDTPQVSVDDVAPVLDAPDRDAWFGPAEDGGFWSLYLREPTGDLLRGVPMSQDDTGAVQLARLTTAGLDVGVLTELLDVDTIDDAGLVAGLAPDSGFAAALRAEDGALTAGGAR
ncbi:TIGR04282 family arsenosugar biosynthesis glycosyltransferase [Curtobacterium sp. Curtsp57]|uniref:TIGR04282 family arsenosugar biosynthesis glycosyltransferase n=1 Tax=Curtobacterium sp. Curtsp57 TaxID=3243047 RepID=UPI0039B56A68